MREGEWDAVCECVFECNVAWGYSIIVCYEEHIISAPPRGVRGFSPGRPTRGILCKIVMTNYMMGSGNPVRDRPGRPGRTGGRSAAAGSACGGRQRATSDRAREDSGQFPPRLGWGCTLGIFSPHPHFQTR